MRFPFLASFIIFILWLSYEIAKSQKKQEKQQSQFWERERRANQTRRKPLDDLPYVKLSLETLPMTSCSEQAEIAECAELIAALAQQKIVNFTGYTNTDLKLQYGAPNLPLLMEYDQNYTLLVRTLQKWALLLYEQGCVDDALSLLEFAVSTGSDVSGTYRLLARIYRERSQSQKLDALLLAASSLRSSTKELIVRILQESDPSDD